MRAQRPILKLALSMNGRARRQLLNVPDEIALPTDVALPPAQLVGEQRSHRVALRALSRDSSSGVGDLAPGIASRQRGSTGSGHGRESTEYFPCDCVPKSTRPRDKG